MPVTRKTLLLAAPLSAVVFLSSCQETTQPRQNVAVVPVEEVSEPEPVVVPYEPGSSAFETWYTLGDVSVRNDVAEAPDDTQSADILVFDGDALLSGIWAQSSVEEGERVTGSVWLWADRSTQAAIFLTPACGSSSEDSSLTYVDVTDEPTRFDFEHTFDAAHACIQIQMKAMQPPVRIYAWKAKVG